MGHISNSCHGDCCVHLNLTLNDCYYYNCRILTLNVTLSKAKVEVGYCQTSTLAESTIILCQMFTTVVPALGDPRRERPPAVCGHFVSVPTHFKVKLPVISGHLPNADADSHLLVVSTCYNGQYKQMPRFPWSFQPTIARAHPNLRPTDLSNFRAVVW